MLQGASGVKMSRCLRLLVLQGNTMCKRADRARGSRVADAQLEPPPRPKWRVVRRLA